ncbi:MAG: hypothetical protein M3247_06770, partial [Thermoproteota archaeon]|nr:hypothetical protein [Thermoproteota archaeon]
LNGTPNSDPSNPEPYLNGPCPLPPPGPPANLNTGPVNIPPIDLGRPAPIDIGPPPLRGGGGLGWNPFDIIRGYLSSLNRIWYGPPPADEGPVSTGAKKPPKLKY